MYARHRALLMIEIQPLSKASRNYILPLRSRSIDVCRRGQEGVSPYKTSPAKGITIPFFKGGRSCLQEIPR